MRTRSTVTLRPICSLRIFSACERTIGGATRKPATAYSATRLPAQIATVRARPLRVSRSRKVIRLQFQRKAVEGQLDLGPIAPSYFPENRDRQSSGESPW